MRKVLIYFFVLPFVLAQFLAIFLVLHLKNITETELTNIKIGIGDWWLIVLYIVLFAFVFFFIRRFFKSPKLFFRILFFIAIFSSFEIFLATFTSNPVIVFLGAFLLILFYWFVRLVLVHNILMIIIFSTLAAFLGLSFSIEQILILLLVLSIYDYISVYKTKHMQAMAKDLINWRIAPAIIIPANLSELLGPKKETPLEGHNYFILGGGDIVFPISLVVALFLYSPLKAVFSASALLIGVFVTYYIFISKKEAIPALPGLVFFTVLGFVVANSIVS